MWSPCDLFAVMIDDTTSDTTESATTCNSGQLPAKKSSYLSGFCNIQQPPDTDVGGLWLRRARVRVPSVTPRGEPVGMGQRNAQGAIPWLY